jgi:hypothetical protein
MVILWTQFISGFGMANTRWLPLEWPNHSKTDKIVWFSIVLVLTNPKLDKIVEFLNGWAILGSHLI